MRSADSCIIAQQYTTTVNEKTGEIEEKNIGLCRLIPRYEGSNSFLKEISTISDCDVFLEWNKESGGLCFGFNFAS